MKERLEREQRRQQAFWDKLAEKERQRTSQRKRKKRRKKKTPRASSHLTLRRAHRRQRQWSVHGWFCCFGAPLDVFPSFVGGAQLLGIMDGMDQNDRTHRALVVDFWQWHMQSWFC